MTYSYNNGAEVITNVYSAHDSRMIANYMSKFTPTLIKQNTHSSDMQHKAYVDVDTMHNPLNIDVAFAKHIGIR